MTVASAVRFGKHAAESREGAALSVAPLASRLHDGCAIERRDPHDL